MANNIDPKALISSSAQLGDNITIGPYAVIGDNVVLQNNIVIDGFAHVLGYTTIGKGTHIFPYAVVGNVPQDLKYRGEETYLVIGENNLIREFVTINPATAKGNKTVIGDGNLLMAYCHVGHDCVIGSNNIFANAATLAGHVTIEDKTVIGGLAGIHQFVKVGKYSIIGGCSKVSHDVLPFSMLDGNPGKTQGLNLVGLRRANFSNDSVVQLKKALDILLDKNRLLEDALRDLSNSFTDDVNVNYLIDFVRSSKRGIGR